MNYIKFLAGLALAALLCTPYIIRAENEGVAPVEQKPATSALKVMQGTVDQLVKVVETLPGSANTGQRRSQLRQVIEPIFDFREMAKRSLGANWNSTPPQDQEEFVRLFSDLLANTYLNRIENIRANTVTFEGEKVKHPLALVKTMIDHRGDRFPIDYKLMARNGEWRVYDVIIENIGLVTNYRNEFAGIVRKEKMSGLLRRLREKNQNRQGWQPGAAKK